MLWTQYDVSKAFKPLLFNLLTDIIFFVKMFQAKFVWFLPVLLIRWGFFFPWHFWRIVLPKALDFQLAEGVYDVLFFQKTSEKQALSEWGIDLHLSSCWINMAGMRASPFKTYPQNLEEHIESEFFKIILQLSWSSWHYVGGDGGWLCFNSVSML